MESTFIKPEEDIIERERVEAEAKKSLKNKLSKFNSYKPVVIPETKKEVINPSLLKSKKDIIDIQTKLVNAGIDIGKFGINKNGVDGFIGKKTLEGIKKYNSSVNNNFKLSFLPKEKLSGEYCIEDQCAEYSKEELYRRANINTPKDQFFKSVGLLGNAWEVSDNILSKKGTLIYNENDKINRSNLSPNIGDIVSIYTGGRSDFQKEADEKGDGLTHTGFISKVYPDGSYDIEHNIHKSKLFGGYEGKAYTSHVNKHNVDGFSYRVKKITRPNYGSNYSESVPINEENKLFYKTENKNAVDAVNFINSNKKKLALEFKLDEANFGALSQGVIGIINRESKFGESPMKLIGKEVLAEVKKRAQTAFSPEVYGKDEEASKGLGRIKHTMNFGDVDHSKLFKTSSEGQKAAVEVMAILSKNYHNFKNKGFNDKDALYRAIAAHNSPKKAKDTNEDSFANKKEIDYVNKVLFEMGDSGVYNSRDTLRTTFDELKIDPNIINNIINIPSIKRTLIKNKT